MNCEKGDLFLDKNKKHLYIFDGKTWKRIELKDLNLI